MTARAPGAVTARAPGLLRAALVFVLTGGAGTLLSWLAYVGLLRLGLGLPAAYTLSFVLGLLFSALVNLRHAFGVRRSAGNLLRYAAAYGLMWLLGLALVATLARAGVPEEWAPVVALPATVPLSFLLLRLLLRTPPGPPP